MAKYEFDKEKFEEWKRSQKESAELQEKMNSSIGGYLESIKKLGELQKNIQFIEQKVAELKKEQVKAQEDLKKNQEKINKATAKGDADEVEALKEKRKELKKILAEKKEGVAITEHEVKLLKKQTTELAESAKQSSLISAGFNSTVGFLGKVPSLIKKGFGMLRGTGIFEMDKEIRNAVRSMAGGQKEYNNMYNTITKAAETTTMWGVGVKDLAIMQRGYTEAIGRSVMLTEQGFKAMAGMAEGTGLGKEFAVQMAGEMDKFNISAERSSTIVEDTMNNAAKIGVNGAAALKTFQNNLKLAQRFNFKGGIDGLAKFSVEATKLKLDMEGIAGMAEKVFRPEGAIEMAAQLTTLGGKFGALGDPMQLMFKARNKPEEFAKDIGRASAEFGKLNEKTGEFELNGGLALDRMRELSKVTGLSVEKLQEMAEAQAVIAEVGKTLQSGMFNQVDTDLISSMAKFDKDKGWVINIKGQDKLVKDLRQTDMANIKAEEKTLEDRALEARTFDETLQDLILQFKQILLPFAKNLKEYLGKPIQELSKTWSKEGFYTSLRNFVTGISEVVGMVGKFLVDNPVATLIAAFTTGLAGKAITWITNGLYLAQGFRMGGGGMGGGGFGGGMPGASGKFGVPGGQIGPALPMGRAAKFGKFMGGPGGAGILAGGIAAYSEYSENSALGIGTGENIGRTVAKGGGAGAGAAAGAAFGAFAGPLGVLIGAAIGGIAGSELGESIGDAIFGDEERLIKSTGKSQRYIKPQVNDGVIFHPQDKFLKVNDTMMIAGTQAGGNAKLAQTMTGNQGSSNQTNHKFDELKIKIDVSAPSDSAAWREVFNSPEMMRRLTQEVHMSSEASSSGGKLTGSGPKRRSK